MNPTNEASASINVRNMIMESAYRVNSYKDSLGQAEAIARHYVAHAVLAVSILRLLELKRENELCFDADEGLRIMVDKIKSDHAKDFGIALEWPQPEINPSAAGSAQLNQNQTNQNQT